MLARLGSVLFLIALTSCASKYVVPSNRFITPETQGGSLKGQFELEKTHGTEMVIDTSEGTVTKGVIYKDIDRSGYLWSLSAFDAVDFIWSHVASGNSLVGGKVQFLGDARASKGAGHKASAVFLFGGNEHTTTDESVTFHLSGQELDILYGYRFTENVLPYTSFTYSKYKFQGTINESGSLNGLKPNYLTTAMGFNFGVELSFQAFSFKLESTYQQLETNRTKDKTVFTTGFTIGVSW